MEIIRKGLIIPEEKLVAEKLHSLPDSWWCIAGENNRFSFRKGEGTQIDFIIIAPKGVFLIDAKNINTIELAKGNIVKFYNSEGKQIRKSKKRESPIEDIIQEKYLAKDWLTNKTIEDFLSYDRKDIRVFIHGLVVIANESSVSYKNCTLQDIQHYKHKYPTLLPLSELNEDFFEDIKIPPNCKELTKEEMWMLFKVFYNPNLSVVGILNSIKEEENTLFQEKQVLIEKIRLIEKENININTKIKEFEGTRNNLISLNQELNKSIGELDEELKQKNKLIQKIKEEKHNLETDKESLIQKKESLTQKAKDYESKIKDKKGLKQKLVSLERENKKINSILKEKTNILSLKKQLIGFKTTALILAGLLIVWIGYNILTIENSNTTYKIKGNPNNILSTIEILYPNIEDLHNKKNYKKLIELWEENKPEKDISYKDFRNYDKLFFYIAIGYFEEEDYKNTIKYFDTYSEFVQDESLLRDIYVYRSIAHIKLNVELGRAITDLKKALQINKQSFSSEYKAEIQIIWNLSMCLQKILIDNPETKQEYYSSNLKIKDFYSETIKYLRLGRNLASKNYDIITQANFQIELGHTYIIEKQIRLSIEQFKESILLLKSIEPRNKQIEKQIKEQLMLTMNDLGSNYANIEKNSLAEEYYKKALEINNEPKTKNHIYEAQINRNLAALYIRIKQYENALKHIEKAMNIAQKLKLPELQTYNKEYEETKKLYEEQ